MELRTLLMIHPPPTSESVGEGATEHDFSLKIRGKLNELKHLKK